MNSGSVAGGGGGGGGGAGDLVKYVGGLTVLNV